MELSAEAVEILQAGRRRVMAGWCQGRIADFDSESVCAYGAIAWGNGHPFIGVHGPTEWDDVIEALYALEDEAGLTHAPEGATAAIAVWNDAPERTHADVVALFESVLTKATVSESAAAYARACPRRADALRPGHARHPRQPVGR